MSSKPPISNCTRVTVNDAATSAAATKPSHITLKDVARLAGVSPITVSRALSKPELVSAAARHKVAVAVEQTGYVSNSLARGLTSARTRLIAAVVPSIAHSLFSEMAQSVINVAAEHGYHTMLGLSCYSAEQEETLIATILSRRPDGLALTGTEHTTRAKKLILMAGIPVVELWDYTTSPIDMVIGFSHEEVGRAACRHLLEKGYRRLAILRSDDSRAGRRADGFLNVAREMDCSVPVEYVFSESLPQLNRGRSGLRELLNQDPGIDAVFCSSDALAQGVLAYAHERGLDVPVRLGVLGFGDQALASTTIPPLSSIRIDGLRMGQIAARGLLSRIEGWSQRESAVVDIGFELIQRAST